MSIPARYIERRRGRAHPARQPRRQGTGRAAPAALHDRPPQEDAGTATSWRSAWPAGFMEPLESTSLIWCRPRCSASCPCCPIGAAPIPAAEAEFNRLSIDGVRADPRLHHPALQVERARRSRSGATAATWRSPTRSPTSIELFRARGKVARHEASSSRRPAGWR